MQRLKEWHKNFWGKNLTLSDFLLNISYIIYRFLDIYFLSGILFMCLWSRGNMPVSRSKLYGFKLGWGWWIFQNGKVLSTGPPGGSLTVISESEFSILLRFSSPEKSIWAKFSVALIVFHFHYLLRWFITIMVRPNSEFFPAKLKLVDVRKICGFKLDWSRWIFQNVLREGGL